MALAYLPSDRPETRRKPARPRSVQRRTWAVEPASNKVSGRSDEQRRVASRTPGTCGGRLWLLPSGPDQVHHHAMRGGPPLFVTVRAYMRTHYLRM